MWHGRTLPLSDPGLVGAAAGALLSLALGAAWLAPALFWPIGAATVAAGAALLAFLATEACTVAWLVATAASLEMTLFDLVGPQAFQTTIAIDKAAGIGLAGVAVLRYGPRLDLFNPSLAWLVMFAAGWAHGLWPTLSPVDSLRSLIGSIAPFMFGFSRLSRSWAETIIRATAWCPALVVSAAAPLALTGLRPMFINSGGLRLAGLGHPAFLAAVCETAVYASLLALYRRGRRRDLLLLSGNFVLLLLTGARAPLTYALAVTGLSLVLVRSDTFPASQRLLLLLAGTALMPLAALLAFGLLPSELDMVRAFNVLNVISNLSGRQFLWPNFAAALADSPWFGWGVGAGNEIIPIGDPVAALLQTRAAHNEYLRVAVEGGELGRALLILLMLLWVRQHTAPLRQSDRVVMRLVFVAFAAHALTDNLLISTPACVLFTFTVAVATRGAYEAAEQYENTA